MILIKYNGDIPVLNQVIDKKVKGWISSLLLHFFLFPVWTIKVQWQGCSTLKKDFLLGEKKILKHNQVKHFQNSLPLYYLQNIIPYLNKTLLPLFSSDFNLLNLLQAGPCCNLRMWPRVRICDNSVYSWGKKTVKTERLK